MRPVYESEREERSDEDRLHRLETQHGSLVDQRHHLIAEVRRIASEQKSLYDRRQAPQAEVEKLYDEHGKLGKRLAELRTLREKARHQVETKVIARRELLLKSGAAEPARPEQRRQEIAALELRHQTQALPIEEENALLVQVRERTKELTALESHAAQNKKKLEEREAADAAILEAKGAVELIVAEMERGQVERDRMMLEIRTKLEAAGGMLAEMRAKGRARADLMSQVDALSKEISALELEGREVFQRLKAHRDAYRERMKAFSSPRERAPARDMVSSAADRRFEELMKRGKVNLG
jgi:uncharacterized coiled-coil DUF342 family protein